MVELLSCGTWSVVDHRQVPSVTSALPCSRLAADAAGNDDDVTDDAVDVCVVQRKMESGEYRLASEFAEDVRLVFTNCYRYNPPGSDVVGMARKLQVQ